MKIFKSYFTLFLLMALSILAGAQKQSDNRYVRYVNPFIGTMGEGNVFAGACLPHSFIKLGPDTEFNSGAAGYKRNKDILGFSHMHISGMGGPMYGHVQLMPATGKVNPFDRASAKQDETASPGYYSVGLTRYRTKAELTVTERAGVHRYTFPESRSSHILFNAGASLYGVAQNWSSSMATGGELFVDVQKKIVYGYNTFKGGRSTTKPWKVYFYAVFDTPFDWQGTWGDSVTYDNTNRVTGKQIGAYLGFNTTAGQQVKVKVGVSMVSTEKAKQNAAAGLPDWDFEAVKKKAEDRWEKELRKIEVNGISEKDKTIFYTALYHANFAPADWTGENPVLDPAKPYYEDFLCIWDIYRTVTPLLTLVSTKKYTDMLNTLLDIYKQDGWLPDAHSALQREFIQVGTNADVLFADAFVKGLKGIDYNLALEAVKKNGEDTTSFTKGIHGAGRTGLPSYLQRGYIAVDGHMWGRKLTVSRSLEYVYNDYCIYQLAKGLNRSADAARYKIRSTNYKKLWDPRRKLMRARKMDGSWLEPFNPAKEETGPSFYEGHSYTWTYAVPHDVGGLVGLFGGKKAFADSLQYVVNNHYEAYNEPCMLQLYLFLWAGRPDLTQALVRKALAAHFNDSDSGLPGNDDSGTTSAWYLWSRMGIFPVSGQNLYLVGSPSAASAVIHMENGKDVVIRAKNASDKAVYIQSATLNGKPWNKAFFTHDHIKNGATFEFVMGTKPSAWGRDKTPPSLSDNR